MYRELKDRRHRNLAVARHALSAEFRNRPTKNVIEMDPHNGWPVKMSMVEMAKVCREVYDDFDEFEDCYTSKGRLIKLRNNCDQSKLCVNVNTAMGEYYQEIDDFWWDDRWSEYNCDMAILSEYDWEFGAVFDGKTEYQNLEFGMAARNREMLEREDIWTFEDPEDYWMGD